MQGRGVGTLVRMAKNSSPALVLRPFENLPGEADWVALREIVPAATATARTTAEHGARDIVVTTSLPDGWPALHRTDGTVLLALQNILGGGDLSRTLAANLLAILDSEPGTSLTHVETPAEDGPRLQDVLDASVPFAVTLHDGFDYWFGADQPIDGDLRKALDDAAETIIPTEQLAGVDSAYLATFGRRRYLRWSMAVDEDRLVDGVARLHAKRESALGKSRFLGIFRACGIVVPVWDVADDVTLEELEQLAEEMRPRLEAAIASTEPLTSDERRARAGIVARQVSLR